MTLTTGVKSVVNVWRDIMTRLTERFSIIFTEDNGIQYCKILDKISKKEVICEVNNLNEVLWKILGV